MEISAHVTRAENLSDRSNSVKQPLEDLVKASFLEAETLTVDLGDKKPALNVDLWQELLPLVARHEVHYHWVKGHASNEKNNRCDQLAVAESKKF